MAGAPHTTGGPGPPPTRGRRRAALLLLVTAAVMAVMVTGARADKNNNYYMQSLCTSNFLQHLYRKIDGAVLLSQNERNLDCVVTFQTHSILQRFMLRFDLLQLDCNDHLFVYDGAHAVGNFKSDLSCRNTKHSVGIIYTRTNFVTLKYVTDSWGTESNGFRLVITAFKGKSVSEHACEDFRCDRDLCIATDLVCDEVNHCGDGSDEAGGLAACAGTSDVGRVWGIPSAVFVVMVAVILVLVVCVCVVGLVVCLCRRSVGGHRAGALPAAAQGTVPATHGSFPLQQMFGWNGTGSGGACTGPPLKSAPPPPYPGPPLGPHGGTLSRPGNWPHPAGRPLGYSAARVRLYCQAK